MKECIKYIKSGDRKDRCLKPCGRNGCGKTDLEGGDVFADESDTVIIVNVLNV